MGVLVCGAFETMLMLIWDFSTVMCLLPNVVLLLATIAASLLKGRGYCILTKIENRPGFEHYQFNRGPKTFRNNVDEENTFHVGWKFLKTFLKNNSNDLREVVEESFEEAVI